MRNGSIDARRRAPSTNALVLLPILNGDDASVLEALDVPEPGLEQRAHQAGEAGGRVSTLLQHHHSVQATWKGGGGSYKARKVKASIVLFRLHLLTNRGELKAHPPLYS